MSRSMPRTQRLLADLGRVRVEEVSANARERLTVLDSPGAAELPIAVRRAQSVALMLRTVPVHIYPDELIVGLPFSERPVQAGAGPSDAHRLVLHRGVAGEAYVKEAERLLAEASGSPVETYSPDLTAPAAEGGTPRYGELPAYATETELRDAARFGLNEYSNPGHLQAGHARVLTYGWGGLRQQAEERLAGLDERVPDRPRRAAFLQSLIIVLDGARDFALRYADLAADMAAAPGVEPRRSTELLEISRVCRRIATDRPGTFREALQLHFFTHLIAITQGARQLGRFDQYMYPFLAADLSAGVLSEGEERELLECLWVKFNQITDVTEDSLQNMILGGQTPDGDDATNQLSYLCLETTRRLGLIDPKVSVRIHSGSPLGLLRLLAEIIAAGEYQPGVYNDETIIPALAALGIPAEHARDYTNDGCSELLVQGRTNPWCFEAKVLLLKCLERVLLDLRRHATFEELWSALLDEVSRAAEMAVSNTNVLQAAVPRISPNPFLSATVEGCLERMLDLTEGGALYNPAALCASGLADTADALAAVRRFIYQEGTVSREQLVFALANDFAGNERLRQMLLKRAPKFGNNDDEVDQLAVGLVRHMAERLRGRRNPRGGEYVLGLFSYGDYISHGILTGATPDGRHSGTGISPNFSPAPGRDGEGPFAVLQSTAKVPSSLTPNGRAVDITIHPSAVRGPEGIDKLCGLLRAFVAIGEMQVQFNIVDGQTLRAAQQDPERYRNLTVRLWGFPAHFVRLPREFQDHLIARTGR